MVMEAYMVHTEASMGHLLRDLLWEDLRKSKKYKARRHDIFSVFSKTKSNKREKSS
jgi:hypothetical protein